MSFTEGHSETEGKSAAVRGNSRDKAIRMQTDVGDGEGRRNELISPAQ